LNAELPTFIRLFFMPRAAAAENLFLRKQLALFRERKARARQTTPPFRMVMVALARFFNWRDASVIVKPETFLKWHRAGFRSFWRWKSRKRGRPPLPGNLKELIRSMARDNPTWGEERIAHELSLKLERSKADPNPDTFAQTISTALSTPRPPWNGSRARLRFWRVY
jgi:hypothetical protein